MKLDNYFTANIIIYGIWLILSLILLITINNDIRIAASADSASWIKPSINFYNFYSFKGENGLVHEGIYRPPIIPIILSINFLFTKTNSFIPFIIMQILATICTCLILIHLIRDWPSKYKLILTIIFLFNPNIISTTQLIQSEIFTMLFFSICFSLVLNYSNAKKVILSSVLVGIFFGITILSRPSFIFLLFLFPFMYIISDIDFLKSNFNLKKILNPLAHGLISLVICFFVIFPWMNHVKSIEGQYSITSSESRYRFIWDQAVLVTSLSENISYKEAMLKTEKSESHAKKHVYCKNIIDNSVLRSKCFDDLAKEGYKVFFDNSFMGHSIALTRSLVQFFVSGGGQNFNNLLKPKNVEFEKKDWITQKHRFTFLFNNNNFFALICTILTVTFAILMRLLAIWGIVYLIIQKKIAYLIIILGVIAYISLIHIYHGSSRYRVPIEPTLSFLAIYGIHNFKKNNKSKKQIK